MEVELLASLGGGKSVYWMTQGYFQYMFEILAFQLQKKK